MSEKYAFESMADQGLSDIWIDRYIDTDLSHLQIYTEYESDILRRLQVCDRVCKVLRGEVYYMVCDVAIVWREGRISLRR